MSRTKGFQNKGLGTLVIWDESLGTRVAMNVQVFGYGFLERVLLHVIMRRPHM